MSSLQYFLSLYLLYFGNSTLFSKKKSDSRQLNNSKPVDLVLIKLMNIVKLTNLQAQSYLSHWSTATKTPQAHKQLSTIRIGTTHRGDKIFLCWVLISCHHVKISISGCAGTFHLETLFSFTIGLVAVSNPVTCKVFNLMHSIHGDWFPLLHSTHCMGIWISPPHQYAFLTFYLH